MATQSVCYFKKNWIREACRKQHSKESCELSSCDGKSCIERNPKCKFFRDRWYCKFGEWCFLLHIVKKDPEIEKINSENKAFLNRLAVLEKLFF